MVKIYHFQLLYLHPITILSAKIQIIQVNLAFTTFQNFFSFLLKNSISQFWIFLKVEYLDTIWDFSNSVYQKCNFVGRCRLPFRIVLIGWSIVVLYWHQKKCCPWLYPISTKVDLAHKPPCQIHWVILASFWFHRTKRISKWISHWPFHPLHPPTRLFEPPRKCQLRKYFDLHC